MKSSRVPIVHLGMRKHHPLTIALHWATVIAVVVAAALVLSRELLGDKFWRLTLLELHRQIGLLIMLAVLARIFVLQRYRSRHPVHDLPWPMRWAATAVHTLLYALLVGLPLLGWATSNARSHRVSLFGLIRLPDLEEVDSELADRLTDYHVLGAWALLGLVLMHAMAALYHHQVRRDAVLWSMWPERQRARQPSPVVHEPMPGLPME